MMNEDNFLIILKRIRVLLKKEVWFEAKEYVQLEIDNLEKTNKKIVLENIFTKIKKFNK